MTNEEAIKFLQQLYPNGGHCWLDEQRMKAIGMAIKALQEEPVSEEQVKEDTMTIRKEWFDHCKKSWYNEGYIDGEYNRDKQFVKHVSEDFEEALAEEWKGYNDRGAATVDALEDNTQELSFAKGFYRGAKWKAEQMMAKAIDMVVGYLMPNGLMLAVDETKNCYNIDGGDKVKVIIIKDE